MAYYDTTWYTNFGNGTSTGYYAVALRPQNAAVAAGQLVRQFTAPAVNNERVFICIIAGTTANTTDATWVLTRGAKTTDGTATWMECTGIAAVNGDLTNTINWTAAKAIGAPTLGTIIKRNSGASYQICTTAGTLGAAEPAFSDTAGVTTTETSATTVWTSLGAVGNFTGGQAPHARLVNVFGTSWYAAGNTVYVGDNHAETQAANMNISPVGNFTTLNQILCHNHAGSYPPTSLTTGATITTTSGTQITLTLPGIYIFGIKFSSNAYINLNVSGTGDPIGFDSCALELTGSASYNMAIGAAVLVTFNNTTMKFGGLGQTIVPTNCVLIWQNTGPFLATGSSIPNNFLNMGNTNITAIFESVDLSQLTGNIATYTGGVVGSLILKDCKLNASMGMPLSTTSGFTMQLVRSDSGATAYKSARYQFEGTETTETTITRVGGASDPTGQHQSRKIVTTANSQWLRPFKAEPYAIWNPTTGANVTVTIYGTVNAGALPNNDDIWMDVEYLTLNTPPPNYTTLNPADKDTHITLSGGNLTAVGTAGWTGLARAVDAKSAGKFYWETTFNATQILSGVGLAIGSLSVSTQTFGNAGTGKCGVEQNGNVWIDGVNNGYLVGGSTSNITFGTITSGTVICIAVDLTAQLIWWRLGASGNWNNNASYNPATGTGGVSIPNVGTTFPTDCFGGADTLISNFGATAFVGVVPSGFTSGWSLVGSPATLGTIVNTTKANLLAANAAVASDSSTWNNIPAFVSWNPSDLVSVTLTGSNLVATLNANNGGVRSTLGPSSGKWYWEITPNAAATTNVGFGVALGSVSVGTVYGGAAGTAQVNAAGNISVNGSVVVNSIGNPTAATAVCIALDLTAGLIWFRASPTNNWNGSSSNNPATGVGGVSISSITTGPLYAFFSAFASGAAVTANFGGSAFSGTVPSGFTAGVSALWSPFKLVATLSSPQPGLPGYINVRPKVAKPNATFWLDPQITLS